MQHSGDSPPGGSKCRNSCDCTGCHNWRIVRNASVSVSLCPDRRSGVCLDLRFPGNKPVLKNHLTSNQDIMRLPRADTLAAMRLSSRICVAFRSFEPGGPSMSKVAFITSYRAKTPGKSWPLRSSSRKSSRPKHSDPSVHV